MTVKELIEKLQAFDPELPVIENTDYGYYFIDTPELIEDCEVGTYGESRNPVIIEQAILI